jgi:ribose 5-phosphate isomerase B
MKKIILGSDHRGYAAKQYIKLILTQMKVPFEDVGPMSGLNIDYPAIAGAVADRVINKQSEGILICGTGIGMSIAANKIKGIRAALVSNPRSAELAKQHNHANIITLAGTLPKTKIKPIILAWLMSRKSNANRHLRRIKEISKMES